MKLSRRRLLTGAGAAATIGAAVTAADLAGLFKPPPARAAQNVQYRQGIVMAYDQSTGANTVNVGGTDLVDLPILNTSEALLLSPGDVVAVLVVGNGGASTCAILGRLTLPNTPAALTALKVLGHVPLVHQSVLGDVSTTSTSLTTLSGGPAVTATVTTTGRLWVMFGAEMFWTDATPSPADGGGITVSLSGANTVAASTDITVAGYLQPVGTGVSGDGAILPLCRSHLFTGLNAGATTITAQYLAVNSKGMGFRKRFITAIAL